MTIIEEYTCGQCEYCDKYYAVEVSDSTEPHRFCSLDHEADYYVSEQKTDEILKEMEEQHRGDL